MLFSNVDYTPYLYQLKNNMLIIPTKCKQQKYKCDKYHIYILFNFKIMFFSNKFYF
ncbi:Uncharacterised protein [Klebsiella pneumoniae]|jgi:hypothetical protein|nr:Uncharacterised protein [Klebsiella pneumoniae]SYW92690.1 hypothetical protein ABVL1U2_440003 [Acinetobacter baumannii]